MTRAVTARILFFVGLFLVFFPAEAAPSSAETPLAEANSDFTFKGRPIHPGLIREFQNWLSDYRPPITVTLDVGAAYDTNEYADAVTQANDGGVSISPGDSGGRFSYKHIGRLNNGVHVLHTLDKTGGTGMFQSLTFVRFRKGQGFDRDGVKPSERLLMSVVRVYPIIGSAGPDIRIKGNEVRINNGARVIRLRFPATQDRGSGISGMANPASVHCAELGGKLEIRTGDGGEYAMCHLADGTVCEEWALFRKECPR